MTRHLLQRGTLVAALAGFALGGFARADSSNPSGDFAAAEAAAFAEADSNGDGKLTPEEFVTFGTLLRQKLEALRFSRLDANGDGALTQEELRAGHPDGFPPLPPPPF